MNVVDVRGLNKYFGRRHVVKDLTMQVKKGEIFGFLGPNGSGKTTSIRMMCGLLRPDSGSGECLGYDIIKDSYNIKKNVGYMTQRFSYWGDLTIRENLNFVARMYNIGDKRAVDAALEELKLSSRANQLAETLSGGWKQRLALAACMLHKPKLLLLDEPTAGVDPSARGEFWEELHRLAASGISVLVSTHYMDEAERCHKLAYIAYGELLAQGTQAEILNLHTLFTWNMHGERAGNYIGKIGGMPGVEQASLFGNTLHVTGGGRELLAATVKRAAEEFGLEAEEGTTRLEDIFIYLMQNTKNRQ